MSKARLIITAVVLEGRQQSEVARTYGVSPGWVSKLVKRFRAEGETAYEPRSRRPKHSPRALPPATVALITTTRKQLVDRGHDGGPHTIAWHLEHHHDLVVSPATISRVLTRAGLVTPEPKKRPRTSYLCFEADQPNETWQSDFTHYPLADGTDVEILTFLDDHSRYALAITAHRPVTGADVLATFRTAMSDNGIPASTLTDNGLVYTARFRSGRNAFEHQLRRLDIHQKNSHPNHPQTCGKVERFQQSMKNWLRKQPQPTTIAQLQALLDTWRHEYNHTRPHRSLNRRTPAAAYQSRPKATPTGSTTGTHERIRYDRVDGQGKVTLRHDSRLHHIGIGRTHARTPVIMLIQDLHIRIVHALTGELLRELTLDPNKGYQPTGHPQTRRNPRT